MLFIVHTSFNAKDNETGCFCNWSSKDKIEAPDKETAKRKAWEIILNFKESKRKSK